MASTDSPQPELSRPTPGQPTLGQRLWITRGVLARAFGVRGLPWLALGWFGFVRVLVALGGGLDRIAGVRPPRELVLIAGVPRSGTTFLHRFLAEQGVGAASHLFRMVFPAASLQRLLRPVIPLLEWASPTRWHRSEAHEGSLLLAETDDALAMLRFHDGFLWYAFFLAWQDEDLLPLVDPAYRDTFTRDLDWADRAWAASAAAQGQDRVLAKSFAWAAQIPRFLERYPKSRVVVLMRDPARTIPSAVSLVRGPLDRALGADRLPEPQRRRHAERLARALTQLYLGFCADWEQGRIDRERVKVIPYPRMMQEFEAVMEELAPFVGLEPTPARRAAWARVGQAQRGRVSAHRYDAGRFGLDAAQIRRDCEQVYRLFGDLDETSREPV